MMLKNVPRTKHKTTACLIVGRGIDQENFARLDGAVGFGVHPVMNDGGVRAGTVPAETPATMLGASMGASG